jgi:hypothetical protein
VPITQASTFHFAFTDLVSFNQYIGWHDRLPGRDDLGRVAQEQKARYGIPTTQSR